MRVLGFTGMPGSGKSEAMSVAKQRGYPVVRMGDLIWDEVEAQGLERTPKNVGVVANGMRETHGQDVWALRTVERIRGTPGAVVMIDGIRSNEEVDVFRRELAEDFLLVAIHTDPDERYERLTARGRDDDADTVDGHKERDGRELNWGIARTIALADEMLVNAGSLEDFHAATAVLLDRVESADSLQPTL